MSDGNIAPVIAGLAAGVALILVFSIFVQNALVATTRLISAVIIPEESSIGNSGNTFEPREIRVVIGYNNTVRWINHDSVPHFVEANTMDDPVFWNTTVNDVNHNNPSSLLQPNDVEGEQEALPVRNGQASFDLSIKAPQPAEGFECPNQNWDIVLVSITYSNVSVIVGEDELAIPGTFSKELIVL